MFVAAVLLAPGVPVRAQTAEEAVLVDGLMKIVGSSFITYQQISAELQNPVRREAGMDLKKLAETRQSIMEDFVQRQLVLNEFNNLEKSRGTNLIPESIIDEIIQERIRSYGDRTEFLKQLRLQGMTYDDYRKNIRDGFIIEQMHFANVPEPIISPHKIETYYAEHQDLFGTKDRVKMLPIVLPKDKPDTGAARRRAEEILSQIKTGAATFDEMARVYSDRPSSTNDWRELSTIAKPIADELARLKPGECSGVVETSDTCFLILLKERDPAHVKPLNEVRDDIEKTLKAQEQNRLTDKWINRLKTKTFIQTF